jgi:hypothetical protein
MANYLGGRTRVLFDGIGGDVLSAGLFLSEERAQLFLDGDASGAAREVLDRLQWFDDQALGTLLRGSLATVLTRERALSRLAIEISRHFVAPNPVGSFFFWNRTRREIALAPYGVLGHIPVVHAPFVDDDVFDFLTSLPVGYLLGHNFHTETIAESYPTYTHIPYEVKNVPSDPPRQGERPFQHDLLGIVARQASPRTMRPGFLWSRLLLSAMLNRSPLWFGDLALYLLQLEELAREGGSEVNWR